MKHFLSPVFGGLFRKKPEHPHFHHLHKKWSDRHEQSLRKIGENHKKALSWAMQNLPAKEHITMGALSGLAFLTTPALTPMVTPVIEHAKNAVNDMTEAKGEEEKVTKNVFLVTDLYNVLPKEVRPLSPEEEERTLGILQARFQLPLKAEMSGIRLERNYGYIGKEQHLARYPGDTIASHFGNDAALASFSKEGMAPGLGAWGYFVKPGETMTHEDMMKEKYYLAIQTFLVPGYLEHTAEYSKFFKHRKMLIVNPQNGKALVVVIGDAGPAPWTGKHLGGSPEVMEYLKRVDGKQKGPVLYYFLDDPENKIPLGPRYVQDYDMASNTANNLASNY